MFKCLSCLQRHLSKPVELIRSQVDVIVIILRFSNRRQHVSAPWSSTATSTGGTRAQHELFELLERVQCSRLDDQRAVLPPYFSQVSGMMFYPHRVDALNNNYMEGFVVR